MGNILILRQKAKLEIRFDKTAIITTDKKSTKHQNINQSYQRFAKFTSKFDSSSGENRGIGIVRTSNYRYAA